MTRSFIILFFLFSQFIEAQDVHYSQFEKTKSLINPSLISSQEEDYEIQLQRRSQWSSITIPFNTFSLSFTFQFSLPILLNFMDSRQINFDSDLSFEDFNKNVVLYGKKSNYPNLMEK